MRSLLFVVGLTFAAGAAAQPFAPEPSRRAPKPEKQQAQQKAPFAAPRRHDPQRERCGNFRRELAQVRQQERETQSTGARDLYAQRRQQILEQRERAGC